eukprot:gene20973-27829_t
MNASLKTQIASSSASVATRQTRVVPCVSRKAFGASKPSTSSSRDVTAAAKGKGPAAAFPGQMEASKREIPCPEVDPENAEFVIFVRSAKYPEGKLTISESAWLPLSIVKGGQAANALVQTCQTKWGAVLFANTLIRNIALAVYKDGDMMEQRLKETPQFKKVPKGKFEFAFKIRDKTAPKDWVSTRGITICPSNAELERDTPQVAFGRFFGLDNLKTMFV